MIICLTGTFSGDSKFVFAYQGNKATVGHCHVAGGATAFTQARFSDSAMVHFYQGSVGTHLALAEGFMLL